MSSDTVPIVYMLLLAFGSLFISFCLNLGEAAAIYIEDGLLAELANTNKSVERINSMLKKYEKLHLGMKLVSLGLVLVSSFSVTALVFNGFVQSMLIENYSFIGFIVCLLAFSFLFFTLGVFTARKVAGFFTEACLPLANVVFLFYKISLPFVMASLWISSLVIRLLGQDPHKVMHLVTKEEIRMLVDEGEEKGTIEEQEKQMINSIFEFEDRAVSQVMTHRTEVVAVPVTATLNEIIGAAIESGHSRLPVYEEDIDSIIGFIYVKDLLTFLNSAKSFVLKRCMRKAIYVPEAGTCSDVFATLKQKKTQIAVVVDEYGGTYGVVTMEDLLESIVGNIEDEYDHEEQLANEVDEGVFILDASVGISEAQRILDFHLPEGSAADTLGGFLTELLGGVPKDEHALHTADYGGIVFTATKWGEKRIEEIKAITPVDRKAE